MSFYDVPRRGLVFLLMSKKRVHQGAATAGEILPGGVGQGGAAAARGYRGGGIPPRPLQQWTTNNFLSNIAYAIGWPWEVPK